MTEKKTFLEKLGKLFGNEHFFIKKNLVPIIAIFIIGILVAMYGIPQLTKVGPEKVDGITAFVTSNLPPELTITLEGYGEVNGLMEYTYSLYDGEQSQEMILYSDMAGNMLFPSAIVLDEVPPTTPPVEQVAFDAPDVETPLVELYVMAFCPYGTQAEDAMLPVARTLGDDTNLWVRYILSETPDGFQSLHGQVEVDEAARQLCVLEEFGKESYWDYLEIFNSDCVDLTSQEAYEATLSGAEACSDVVVNELELDYSAFEDCMETDSYTLLKTQAIISEAKKIGSSPTLLVNDEKYGGSRTAEGYKNAVCSGFETEPSACDAELSSEGIAAAGSC